MIQFLFGIFIGACLFAFSFPSKKTLRKEVLRLNREIKTLWGTIHQDYDESLHYKNENKTIHQSLETATNDILSLEKAIKVKNDRIKTLESKIGEYIELDKKVKVGKEIVKRMNGVIA